jgi:hypothetical protein
VRGGPNGENDEGVDNAVSHDYSDRYELSLSQDWLIRKLRLESNEEF